MRNEFRNALEALNSPSGRQSLPNRDGREWDGVATPSLYLFRGSLQSGGGRRNFSGERIELAFSLLGEDPTKHRTFPSAQHYIVDLRMKCPSAAFIS
jgi:hypothetical protein